MRACDWPILPLDVTQTQMKGWIVQLLILISTVTGFTINLTIMRWHCESKLQILQQIKLIRVIEESTSTATVEEQRQGR